MAHKVVDLTNSPPERGIKKILEIVVSATWELLGDVGPPVAHLTLQLKQLIDLGPA